VVQAGVPRLRRGWHWDPRVQGVAAGSGWGRTGADGVDVCGPFRGGWGVATCTAVGR